MKYKFYRDIVFMVVAVSAFVRSLIIQANTEGNDNFVDALQFMGLILFAIGGAGTLQYLKRDKKDK